MTAKTLNVYRHAAGVRTQARAASAQGAGFQAAPQAGFQPNGGSLYTSWQQGQAIGAPVQQPQQPQVSIPSAYANSPALRQAYEAGLHQQLPHYAQPIQHFASHGDERAFDGSGTFNPMSWSGDQLRAGIRSAIVDPHQRMFDNAGQLNAYDRKDALRQASHLLRSAALDAQKSRMHRQVNAAEAENQRKMLIAAAKDPEGFALMGEELLLPIKDMIDYDGWIRKIFRVRSLGQGEYFRLAKDVRAPAFVIGQDGQGVESRMIGRYVVPTEFKIGSFPTIDIETVEQMNYDVLDRAQSTARQEIMLEEDRRGLALLEIGAKAMNTVSSFVTLGIGAFEDVRFQVERHRLTVEKFLINRAELSDVVKTMSSAVDPVTERELLLAGYIGSILNAVILTSAGVAGESQSVVPAGTMYAVAGPEYLGEMAIRTELFSEPFNMFAQRKFVKGWAFGEIIGFVLGNPRAVAKGMK